MSPEAWEELDWHINEARYWNTRHSDALFFFPRLLRAQGKINRLLIHAIKNADFTSTCLATAFRSSARLSNTHNSCSFSALISDDIETLSQLNRTKVHGSTVWKRINRDQQEINRLLQRVQTNILNKLEQTTSQIKEMPAYTAIYSDPILERQLKVDMPWHVREIDHLIGLSMSRFKWISRLKTRQMEINRLSYSFLELVSRQLKAQTRVLTNRSCAISKAE
ncbi:MAG: hypothetical protein SFY80_09145 [Verrucomicrobiota bacterium]|nr:hypothetical protein [Verrucomicrobiota bacterium]